MASEEDCSTGQPQGGACVPNVYMFAREGKALLANLSAQPRHDKHERNLSISPGSRALNTESEKRQRLHRRLSLASPAASWERTGGARKAGRQASAANVLASLSALAPAVFLAHRTSRIISQSQTRLQIRLTRAQPDLTPASPIDYPEMRVI